jgi:hypothetical protein
MTTKTRRPSKNGHAKLAVLPPVEVIDNRKPVAFKPDAAVMSILHQLVTQLSQTDTIKVALGSFCEGRGLEGQWSLRITGAELVPVK